MSLRGRLPILSLAAGAVAISVTVPVVLSMGVPSKELPWVASTAVFVTAAWYTRRRLPEHPVARWFAQTAGLVAMVQMFDGVVLRLGNNGGSPLLPWAVFGYHVLTVVAVVAVAHLLGLFPDGQARRPYERRVLRSLWWLLALPPLVLLGRPTLLTPGYHQLPDIANPYYSSLLALPGRVAGPAVAAMQAVFVIGAVLLALRYRHASDQPRRQIRWLLIPGLLAAAVALVDTIAWRLFPGGAPSTFAEVALTALWILTISSLPVFIAVALLRPQLFDVDHVIRRSLVYGLLWAAIAAAYVGAAAGLGLAAGRRLPVGLAIALAVGATLVFQPARRRLESVADRWVFGKRAEPARLVADLGATLEDTVESEQLLPRMAATLQTGLDLRWARVRLEPADPIGEEEPALVVPILLGEERLGVVECGQRRSGVLTDEDATVVHTFARQAALAVRNVRLTAELERSRVRLVKAQDAERRRLERNIHDGVQQDLVALIGHAGHVRRQLREDPAAGERAVDELRAGLHRVIGELRELAHGIHPSVLSDRGLLEAVEALTSRSAIPVSVRAHPALRGLRFAEEVEGAGYFTVAEALANAGKHAGATQVEVSLGHADGSLHIQVHDDGEGFDPAVARGDGLANLAERLAALGGRLEVASVPGRGTTVSARLRVADG